MVIRGGLPAILLFLATGALPVRAADAVAELGKFSAFEQLDLSKLSGGKVLTARGPAGVSPRDLSFQAVYLVPAPVAKTAELHRQWDPSRHSELKVYLHGDVSGKPSAADFAKLSSAPSNASVRELAAATQKLPANDALQLSKAEAQEFGKAPSAGGGTLPAPVVGFWSTVLAQRASAFLARGLAGQPPYEGKETARAAEEASRLLKEQPKIKAQFSSFLGQTPLGGGNSSPELYWELFDVDGEGALSLGASYGKGSGDTAQSLDLQYYGSGGFYVYLTLLDMRAVTFDGKAATLVWRGDFLASQAVGNLRGMEKMGSGAAMMKEGEKAIKLFLRDTAR